jgi:PAS domain S-box-containing protein
VASVAKLPTFNAIKHIDDFNTETMDTTKKAEDRFKGFLESLPDAIVIVDNDGKIQIVNVQTEKLFGYIREELIGKEVEVLMPSKYKNAHHGHRQNFSANPKARAMGIGMELFGQHKDGKVFPVAISISRLETDEGFLVAATIRDVSYEKEIEKALIQAKESAEKAKQIAEDAMQAKQTFLSNMSHEIRTPMTAIIGFSKVLLKTDLTEKQKEYITAIKTSSDALLVLINDILDLAKVDAGKMTFDLLPFNLKSSISIMLHLFDIKFQEKRLKLFKEFDNNIPEFLLGDSVRLNQIMLNLISNAIKFTTEGQISVRVHLKSEDDDKVNVEFAVTDTGIGIPENMLATIFENFEQATTSTARLFGGTGLGLAIVKKLVEKQGGNIDVKSKIGEGSTFSFVLSFQKSKAETHLTTGFTAIELVKDIRNIKVLVVEDVALNQLLMKIILDDFGFEREIADNGKIAIEKLQAKSFDIILMDLQMPEMNGYEATELIRKKLNSNIPIIALTADVTETDLAQCKAVGMNDHIAKPIDEKQLYNKIIKLVKK